MSETSKLSSKLMYLAESSPHVFTYFLALRVESVRKHDLFHLLTWKSLSNASVANYAHFPVAVDQTEFCYKGLLLQGLADLLLRQTTSSKQWLTFLRTRFGRNLSGSNGCLLFGAVPPHKSMSFAVSSCTVLRTFFVSSDYPLQVQGDRII